MPFKPGQSGNPGGRPKVNLAADLARAHTEDAVRALVAALENPKERVQAAIALLNRGWGMPTQTIAGDEDAPLLSGIKVEFVSSAKPSAPSTD